MATAKDTEKTDTVTAPHVYQAIAAITRQMAQEGISKDRKNQQQNYSFRGIDDVYNALAPMLAEHSLCILPEMINREVVERQSAKGSALFYVTVEANFHFISAKDGSKHTVKTFGEAMDSADKATNKAMSAAYKYACIQAFCIPTQGDNDADAVTHEVAPKKEPEKNGPLFKNSEERMDWVHKAGKLIPTFQNPEEIQTWESENEPFIQALGEKQRGWVEDLLAKRREQTYQRPAPVNGATAQH